jgi:hypothetical protein
MQKHGILLTCYQLINTRLFQLVDLLDINLARKLENVTSTLHIVIKLQPNFNKQSIYLQYIITYV